MKHVLADISRSRYNTPQYRRNVTAHAAGGSILLRGGESSPACVVRGTACSVRWAWRITAGLWHAFLMLP